MVSQQLIGSHATSHVGPFCTLEMMFSCFFFRELFAATRLELDGVK